MPSPAAPMPTLMTLHDLTPLTNPEWYSCWAHTLFARHIRWGLARGASFVAVSAAVAADARRLLSLPADRVTVATLGVPLGTEPVEECTISRIKQAHGLADRPYILFLGQMTPRKNPGAAVKAIEALGRRSREVDLAMIGSPGLATPWVGAMARALNIADRVRLLGHLPREETIALLGGATALVLPSRYEGFGLPALEAMSLGVPVVVSDGGSLPEVVGDAGIIVRGGNADGLADAVDLLLRDASAARDLAVAGRRRAATFTWTSCAERTVEVYRRLL